jgi:predicted MFS family arabinose efflux permease
MWVWLGAVSILMVIATAIYLYCSNVIERQSAPPAHKEDQGPRKTIKQILSKQIFLLWAILFLTGLFFQPFQTYLSPYIRDELGYSVNVAGDAWSAIGFVGMWGGFCIGIMADKIGVRRALILCYLMLITATTLILLHFGEIYFIGAGLAYGLAYYAIAGLVPAFISKEYSPAIATTIFAVGNILKGAGGVCGNFLGGYTKTLFGTFEVSYAIGAVIAIVLILITRSMVDRDNASQPVTSSGGVSG